MIAQECRPVLGPLSASLRREHVLANCVWTRRIETEKRQMPMDSLSAPQHILVTELPDQNAHLLTDCRAPYFIP
jgi:hypothetical protein